MNSGMGFYLAILHPRPITTKSTPIVEGQACKSTGISGYGLA